MNSSYRLMSVTALLIAAVSTANGAETEEVFESDTAVQSTVQRSVVPASEIVNMEAAVQTDGNKERRLKRLEQFSVEFADDVEKQRYQNTIVSDDTDTINLGTTRIVSREQPVQTESSSDSAGSFTETDVIAANKASSKNNPNDTLGNIKTDNSNDAGENNGIETVDSYKKKKRDTSAVFDSAEHIVDKANARSDNKTKGNADQGKLNLTDSVVDPKKNISSGIMKKADAEAQERNKDKIKNESSEVKNAEPVNAPAAESEDKAVKTETVEETVASSHAESVAENSAASGSSEITPAPVQEKAEKVEDAGVQKNEPADSDADKTGTAPDSPEEANTVKTPDNREEQIIQGTGDVQNTDEKAESSSGEAQPSEASEDNPSGKNSSDSSSIDVDEVQMLASREVPPGKASGSLKEQADNLGITDEMLYSKKLDRDFPLPEKLPGRDAVKPAAKNNVDLNASNGEIIVKNGEGLELLGKRVAAKAGPGVSKYQAAVALYRRNASKFSSTSPVYPYADTVLVVPTRDQIALESEKTYVNVLLQGTGVISADSLPALTGSRSYSETEYDSMQKAYNSELEKVLEARREYLINQYNLKAKK